MQFRLQIFEAAAAVRTDSVARHLEDGLLDALANTEHSLADAVLDALQSSVDVAAARSFCAAASFDSLARGDRQGYNHRRCRSADCSAASRARRSSRRSARAWHRVAVFPECSTGSSDGTRRSASLESASEFGRVSTATLRSDS